MEQISENDTLFLGCVLCTGKKSSTPLCCCFPPITLCFFLYSYFHHFGSNRCGPKPSWLVVVCGIRSASAKEMYMHLSKPAIVFVFPKSWMRTIVLCIAPPRLAQVLGHVSELNSTQHIALDKCRMGTNSNKWPKTCASLERSMLNTIMHSQFNQNYWVSLLSWIWWAGADAAYISSSSINLWKQRILGNFFGKKKLIFVFWRKGLIFVFFSLHSFIVMFFVDMSEFSLLLFYEEKIKVGFSAYSISNENLTSYKWII